LNSSYLHFSVVDPCYGIVSNPDHKSQVPRFITFLTSHVIVVLKFDSTHWVIVYCNESPKAIYRLFNRQDNERNKIRLVA